MEKTFSTEWLGRTLTIKTGKLAKQATAAVTVQYGDVLILATVVQNKEERDVDFFPLMVDMEERLYAAGIIKGSRWIKREGRPTDDSVLTGRMIDRSIRPLFNDSSRKEVQVMLTVMSVDQENDHDIISLVAASAVLGISGIDWRGPIGGIRVGQVNGEFVFNPTYAQRLESSFDLIVAGTKEKVLMIEAGGAEVPENVMYDAIVAAQREIAPVTDLIAKMAKELGVKPLEEKKTVLKTEDELKADAEKEKAMDIARAWLKDNVGKILFDKEYYTKGERKAAVTAIKTGLDEYLFGQGVSADKRKMCIGKLVEKAVDAEITRAIVEEKRRVDGRGLDDIRGLEAEVGLLPRTHGSSLFSRGETQVLSIVTLAGPGLEQNLEGVEGAGTKRFFHHYNFPPFSVGEAKPNRGAGRREIGHGALAEKAVVPMLPTKEEFPYVIRVVSETLGSNGSSSQASACACSMALMDAGVPIKKPVAGIAMGLASYPDMSKWEVLTDLQDLEDGNGGMDFKIAGSREGITAIQLDTKTEGLTPEIVKQTLEKGKIARTKILDVMATAIPAPRPDLSPYAPRITQFMIEPDKIREVIGSGGKVINAIIAATGVTIDIDDDGTVMVCGTDAEKSAEAVKWIKDIVRKFEVGEQFTGKVVRLMDFGAFIELLPGRDGMVHVSKMAPYRVGKPSDLLNVGDVVTVRIDEIDEQGRTNLTMKGFSENQQYWEGEKGKSTGDFGGPRGGNGGGRSFDRPRNGSGGGGFRRDDRGPRPPRTDFPTPPTTPSDSDDIQL